MKCSSSVVNPFDVATLLLASFYRYVAANKEYLTKDIIFRCVNLVRSVLLYCLKFSFKLANTFWSYEEKKRFLFPYTVYSTIFEIFNDQEYRDLDI